MLYNIDVNRHATGPDARFNCVCQAVCPGWRSPTRRWRRLLDPKEPNRTSMQFTGHFSTFWTGLGWIVRSISSVRLKKKKKKEGVLDKNMDHRRHDCIRQLLQLPFTPQRFCWRFWLDFIAFKKPFLRSSSFKFLDSPKQDAAITGWSWMVKTNFVHLKRRISEERRMLNIH